MRPGKALSVGWVYFRKTPVLLHQETLKRTLACPFRRAQVRLKGHARVRLRVMPLAYSHHMEEL